MRRLATSLAIALFSTIAIADTPPTYKASPIPGIQNVDQGMFLYEIVQEEDQSWTLKQVRGGANLEALFFTRNEQLELASQPLADPRHGELLIVDPKSKIIYLGAKPVGKSLNDPHAVSAYEKTRKDKDHSSECYLGLLSTAKRSKGYTVCTSFLTRQNTPALEFATGFINWAFGTVRVRKEVNPEAVLAAAQQAGVIKDAEARISLQYSLIKKHLEQIIHSGSGQVDRKKRDVLLKHFSANQGQIDITGAIDNSELVVLLRTADDITRPARQAKLREERIRRYRDQYAALDDSSNWTGLHEQFILLNRDSDYDNLVPDVTRRLDQMKARIGREIRVIGQRICNTNLPYQVEAFVERTAPQKFQLKINGIRKESRDIKGLYMGPNGVGVAPGGLKMVHEWVPVAFLKYRDLDIEPGSVIWDDYEGWTRCD